MAENILDRILEEQGLHYEDLNAVEKETYNRSNFNLQKLSVADVLTYVTDMKNSIALQLAGLAEDDAKNVLLKARLMNYILLESFLMRPEKAEEALRKQMAKA